ncbi:MAG: FAD:protein FMN transferase [Flavitalea sp.]
MNFLLFLLSMLPIDSTYNKYLVKGTAQGTTYSITYYSSDPRFSKNDADSIFKVLDNSLSLYQPNSLINQFNGSKRKIKSDPHLTFVVKKALQIHQHTFRLFDITIKPLAQAWGFGINSHQDPPSQKLIKRLLKCTGSGKLFFRSDFLYKSKPCVQIDVNGIAQGYSVDVIATRLRELSIRFFIIEIGGEIYTESTHPDGSPMKVDIEIPSSDIQEPPTFVQINLPPGALTSSGSYRKYYLNNNQVISHIINPKTGQATTGAMISVTVFATDAITADGFDNAFMLMNINQSKKFLEINPSLAALFVYIDESGKLKKYASPKFPMSEYINSL